MPNETEPTNQAKSALRLLCIGDTHGFHRRLDLPPGDILIHSGDFMVDGTSIAEIDDFNDWLGSLPFRHKLVIAGNHDRLFDRKPKLARAHLTEAIYLQDSGITLEGLHFWGSPRNRVGGDWAFSSERLDKISRHWDSAPAGIDVLITHDAPYGTLDKPHILARHMGSNSLLGAVVRIKPRLHVFGHIHGGYGRESAWGKVIFVNAAVVDGQRMLANAPIAVDLER